MKRATTSRRRLMGLAGLATLGSVATACARVAPTTSTSASPHATSASPTTLSGGTCLEVAQKMTREQRIGQLLMMGIVGDFDAAEKRLIERHEIGAVLLMGNSTRSVQETKALTDSIAQAAGAAPILVAVDHEGGLVQRLKGPGFTIIPNATEQAKQGPTTLRSNATGWGKELAAAGVHLNLAPVADVVPITKVKTNEPVGKLNRGYGSDPTKVSASVTAYVKGMRAGGVGTSVKHFPGLGEVIGNTDFTANVKDDVTTADATSLAPFKAGVEAGTDTVMVSTAYYTKIDPSAPAAFSSKVIALIRTNLGFSGVIISDDLGAAVSMKDVPAEQRGVRFIKAGGDLAITADPAHLSKMAVGMLAEAQKDPAFDQLVTEAAARVLGLKAQRGLAQCTAVVG